MRRSRSMTVSDSIIIAVDPKTVYERISDPRQTLHWSPENTGATFDDSSAHQLAVGDTFIGSNKRGRATWVTRSTVTAADPGSRFAFRVHQIGSRTPRVSAPISIWTYQLKAVPDGTEVTETWTDLRAKWPDVAARAFDYVATGGHTFADFNAHNIATTLRRLKKALEADQA